MRTVQTPLLDIVVEDTGPAEGPPVILLHGWPDCPRTWDRMVPTLHEAGLRTIVPYLRGFGPTRFRDAAAMRSGQLSALGRDLLQLADALRLQQFSVVGHDWGARAAYVGACLAPERVQHCIALSVGWGTNTPAQSLSLQQTQNYWYQWVMALPRGEELLRHDRRAFTRHLWQVWSPGWSVSDAEFETTAAAFENPDWADVVLHSYRSRWGHAPADPSCAEIEARLAAHPVIHAPTLVLHGDADPCNGPETSEGKEALFAGPYRRALLPGVGHFPQREAARQVLAEAVPFLSSRP